jgi:hypothetical protein
MPIADRVASSTMDGHRVLPEIRAEMIKADLRKAADTPVTAADIGKCLFRARCWLGWNLEQLAAELPPPSGAERRDPRQVRRWESGEERTQLDVVFSVPALREPFTVQLARLSGAECTVHVAFRRSA